MAVSTTQNIYGIKDDNGVDNTSKVVSFLNGNRSAEQMIQEYFGLRKEVIYSDDGSEVVDMVNEFKDPEMLQKKKVRYNDYFASKWLTEEMFYKYVPRNLVYNPTTNDKNSTSTGIVEEKPVVSNPRWRTPKNKK